MKKAYSKPLLEIEVYELNTNIAANCGSKVSFGPEAPGKEVCDEFKDAFEVFSLDARAVGGTPFYDDGAAHCDCYYSSGGGLYFTS